jgi:CRISPR-associated protein Csx3
MIKLSLLPADYQILAITSSSPDHPIQPAELSELTLPSNLDLSREIILFGQVPIWIYSALIALCQSAPWIGCFAALEKQAVVVYSRVSSKSPGDVIPLRLHRSACPAILIGGPPDSGKSVLASALRRSFTQHNPDRQVFLHRANWDGEGNWSDEAHNRDLVKRLIREHERRIHEHSEVAELMPAYFNYQAQAVDNLREIVDLVLVDVGGKTQLEKIPLVEQCTHYIVISKFPSLVQSWHDFCAPCLKPLAVIHSIQEQTLSVLRTEPFLEIEAGPWEKGKALMVPDILLHKILQHLGVIE